jgi:hypothetical protein
MTIEEKRKKIHRACHRLLGVPHNIQTSMSKKRIGSGSGSGSGSRSGSLDSECRILLKNIYNHLLIYINFNNDELSGSRSGSKTLHTVAACTFLHSILLRLSHSKSFKRWRRQDNRENMLDQLRGKKN